MMEKINIKKVLEQIVILMFYLYVITITTFSYRVETLWISQCIFIIYILLGAIYILANKKIHIHTCVLWIAVLVGWIVLSVVWAIDGSVAMEKVITLVQLAAFFLITYNCFYISKRYKHIIGAIFVGGMFMCIYSLFYYGISDVINSLINGTRLGNEINQINTYGMVATITFMLSIYFWIYDGKKICILSSVLTFIIVIASGSRSALIVSIFAITLLIYMRYGVKQLVQLILTLTVVVILIMLIGNLQMFDLINERMSSLVNLFVDNGVVDHSTLVRKNMITFGIDSFLNNPIWGYGIGNYSVLYGEKYDWYVYAHNNYIELLVDIGLIGVVIYYSAYIYIIFNLLKLIKKNNNSILIVIFIMIVSQLISDIATVSYYDKMNYIYILLGYLCIKEEKGKCLQTSGKVEKTNA